MALKNKKHLGQNWLKDRNILLNIAEIAHSDAQDSTTALEIGPGLGTLTSALLKFFPRVIAVEYDAALAQKLPGSFPGKRLEVLNADFLDFDLSQIPSPYVAVGNIPYYITSPIVRHLLEATNKPSKIVLTIQKEVAERIAAGPGDHTILSISSQIYAEVTLGPVIDRSFFTPPPKVDSQVIILIPREQPLATEDDLKFIKQPFRNPRKKLTTTLPYTTGKSKEEVKSALEAAQINPDFRPQDLTIEQWLTLRKALTY